MRELQSTNTSSVDVSKHNETLNFKFSTPKFVFLNYHIKWTFPQKVQKLGKSVQPSIWQPRRTNPRADEIGEQPFIFFPYNPPIQGRHFAKLCLYATLVSHRTGGIEMEMWAKPHCRGWQGGGTKGRQNQSREYVDVSYSSFTIWIWAFRANFCDKRRNIWFLSRITDFYLRPRKDKYQLNRFSFSAKLLQISLLVTTISTNALASEKPLFCQR